LGFTEREVGHFTLKKWFALFEHYKKYHNFKVNGGAFKTEKTEEEKLERLWNPFEKHKNQVKYGGRTYGKM
jgi:hypothetical protein